MLADELIEQLARACDVAAAGVASVERSSTTITSSAGYSCARNARTVLSMIRSSFLAGTRIETNGGADVPSALVVSRGMARKFKIVLARAMTHKTRTIVKKVFVERV